MSYVVLRAVQQEEGNPVTLLYPLLEEVVGQTVTGLIQFAVGDSAAIKNDGRLVRVFLGTHFEVLGQWNLA
jgi:hypothetical protein